MKLRLSYFVLALLIAFLFGTYLAQRKDSDFSKNFLHLVRECVTFNKNISNKEEIFELIDQLETKHCVLEKGSDQLRVKYVSFQGAIEHVLACSQALKDIDCLIGMIHTPMPATPLCTRPDPLDTYLLDATIRHDLNKLLTVRSRAQIVREYLTKGGKLYIIYPQGGLEKRTKEQQTIYLDEVERYKNCLIDWVLETDTMPSEMVGATYFFKNKENDIYAFSIKAYQANDPKEESEWGLWFGKVKEFTIVKRLNSLFDYFKESGGPTRSEFNINII